MVNMIKAKILILEPPNSSTSGLSNSLTRLGHQVIGRVSEWQEFSANPETPPLDLLIINLPVKQNPELIKTAEQMGSKYNCALLYLISEEEEEFFRQTNRANRQSYLCKPFRETDLRAAIDLALHKRTLKALRESEERYDSLFDNLPIGIYRTTPEGRILYANAALVKMLGHSCFADMASQNLFAAEFEPSYSRQDFCERLARENQILGLEAVWQTRNGSLMFARENVKVVRDSAGSILYYEGTVEDITQSREARKASENALRASIERYKLLAENSTDVISRHTPKGEYLYISPATRNLLGYEPEEMLGQVVADFLHAEDAADLRLKQGDILRSQNIYTQAYRYRCKDGGYIWLESTIKNIRDPQTERTVEIISVSRDITERKRAEEALRASEERFRNLALNSPDYIFVIDLASKKSVYSNCEALFGYPQEDLNDYAFLKTLIYFEDKETVHENWLRLLDGKTGSTEFRLRKKNGTWEWLNCRFNALSFDAQGNPLQSLLTTSIITERKLAEELLQKYADDLNGLYQHAPCGYHSIDREGIFVRINDTQLNWLGYSRSELIGKLKVSDLIPPRQRKYFSQQFALLKTRGWIKDFETEIICKDGSLLPIILNATAVKDRNGHFIISHITIYDITERRQADDIIRKSHEQMQALSAHLLSVREEERTRIAREIHDELGQALTVLKFDLSALGKKLHEDQHELLEKVWAMSTMIDDTTNSVRRICADLRPAILDFGLTAAIEWLVAEFQKLTGIECDIEVKSAGVALDLTLTEELSTSIFRICQEALTNVARHADATAVSIVLEGLRDKLALSISDNGKGIESSEPSISHSFGILGIKERARLLGGEISIKGEAKSGTRLNLLIPISQQEKLQYV
jgi:PAS domain S-box-containing protein